MDEIDVEIRPFVLWNPVRSPTVWTMERNWTVIETLALFFCVKLTRCPADRHVGTLATYIRELRKLLLNANWTQSDEVPVATMWLGLGSARLVSHWTMQAVIFRYLFLNPRNSSSLSVD